jgi:hypothetical protein
MEVYTQDDLQNLENSNEILDIYIWLSGKFEAHLIETELAWLLRDKVE